MEKYGSIVVDSEDHCFALSISQFHFCSAESEWHFHGNTDRLVNFRNPDGNREPFVFLQEIYPG